jgi:thymidylate synthase (FAD)
MISEKYLKLISHCGSDDLVVSAARVSIEAGSKRPKQDDESLIEYLAKHQHSSPFEHNFATFYVKCPIFVARQWVRHRTMCISEASGRFSSEIYDEMFLPTDNRLLSIKNTDSRQEDSPTVEENVSPIMMEIKRHNEISYDLYKDLLRLGTQKEIARTVLPLGTYTQLYISATLLNWMKFINLRTDIHAQLEIREYADAIKNILSEIYPLSIKYWCK